MTSRRSLTLPVVLALVLTLALAAFAASSFADGRTLTGVLLVVAALAAAYAAVLEIRRRGAAEISQGALADWPPERVHATVSRIDGDVPRVRAVRKADPGRRGDAGSVGGTVSDLQRFVDAQDPVWDDVLAELRAGRKRTHWMWFVFPQLAGLGRSSTAQHYAVADLADARGYLAHPVLGPRLREACDVLLGLTGTSASRVLGSPDDVKLRSSMTLFAAADPDEPRFPAVLAHWYDGPDDATLRLLRPRG